MSGEIWYTVACNAVGAALLLALAWWASRRARPALTHSLCVLAMLELVTPSWVEWAVLPAGGREAGPAPAPEPATRADLVAVLAALKAARDQAPGTGTAADETASVPARPGGLDASEWVLLAWALGSAVALALLLRRVRAFAAVRRHAEPASPGLRAEADRIAQALGLRRSPPVLVVPGRISPMLCPAGLRPEILLPAELLPRLDDRRLGALLAHELAHVRRGDHWVRFLEAAVAVAYWWLPIAHGVRRLLRQSEERCCDAWVVWARSGDERAYADALLDTVDFLAEGRVALPPQACGANAATDLKQRLKMIMQSNTQRSTGPLGRLGVAALAAVLLPVLPTFAQDPVKRDPEAELRRALERIEQLEAKLQKLELRGLPHRRAAERARTDEEPVVEVEDPFEAPPEHAGHRAHVRAHGDANPFHAHLRQLSGVPERVGVALKALEDADLDSKIREAIGQALAHVERHGADGALPAEALAEIRAEIDRELGHGAIAEALREARAELESPELREELQDAAEEIHEALAEELPAALEELKRALHEELGGKLRAELHGELHGLHGELHEGVAEALKNLQHGAEIGIDPAELRKTIQGELERALEGVHGGKARVRLETLGERHVRNVLEAAGAQAHNLRAQREEAAAPQAEEAAAIDALRAEIARMQAQLGELEAKLARARRR